MAPAPGAEGPSIDGRSTTVKRKDDSSGAPAGANGEAGLARKLRRLGSGEVAEEVETSEADDVKQELNQVSVRSLPPRLPPKPPRAGGRRRGTRAERETV